MNISSQLLFFFSALGAFNGLLLTIYLFCSKPTSIQQRLLSALMFVISLRVSKSVWFYFDPNLGKQFLQLGLSACFLIGPFLYFYTASNLGRLNDLKVKWTWHLGFILLLTAGVGILFPYPFHTELWGHFYQFINLSWGIYIALAGILIYSHLGEKLSAKLRSKRSGTSSSMVQLSNDEFLCLNMFLGTTLIWLAYFTASYTSYIVGALSFSFILYVSILLRVFSKKYQLTPVKRYINKKIDDSKQVELVQRLTRLMSEEQLYKNANLTLPLLAKKMQISVPLLSQLLNDNLQKSFNSYVNEWRINEAKRLLKASENMTIELISEASGYNSQSTFYAAFKQFEQTTPAKYRKNLS